jgi:hypothetical protein
MTDVAENDRIKIGGNNPPLSPFDAHRVHIEDLYEEAKNWLDGEPIASAEQADKVSLLLDMIRKAEKAADESRVKENEPFDLGKAEVQARYAPLIGNTKAVKGKTVLAADACKAALAPWLMAVEAEKRRVAEEARKQAEEAARVAAEAARAAAADDLAAQEEAAALFSEAEDAAKAAKRAESDKAGAHGGSRVVTLRSYFAPVLTDGVAAARHYWADQREACEAFFLSLAETDVRAGKRQIPGFEVREDRRAV